ncbi:MAG: hypothetical protein H7144_15945 [Burkholderiales bacterium]|nr:hypothetical protein [Phycisphaerae bacterium]
MLQFFLKEQDPIVRRNPGSKFSIFGPRFDYAARRHCLIVFDRLVTADYALFVICVVGLAVLLAGMSCLVFLMNHPAIAAGTMIMAIKILSIALRERYCNVIRFDRRGMTLCTANFRRRRRHLVPWPQLASCAAHRDWVTGAMRIDYYGPCDAVVLRFVGHGDNFLVLGVGDWLKMSDLANLINCAIQRQKMEPPHWT